MNKKHLYTVITAFAIALSGNSLHAKESHGQNVSNTIFVCGTETDTPTMFAYTPGSVNLTPLIGWHQEYLLPEQSGAEICKQTATKLQALDRQPQEKYLKTESKEDRTLVCLVSAKDETCSSENSEELFSVNPNYDANCILDNREPIECVAVGKVRGIYSVSDAPYQPSWWPW